MRRRKKEEEAGRKGASPFSAGWKTS